MLSFYEFDCLLRKQQPVKEARDPEVMKRMRALLAQQGQSQPATVDPAPPEPAAQAQPAPLDVSNPLAAAAASLQDRMARLQSERRAKGPNRKRSLSLGGAQPDPQTPAIVTTGRSAFDPEAQNMAQIKAGEEELPGGRSGRGGKKRWHNAVPNVAADPTSENPSERRGANKALNRDKITDWNKYLVNPAFAYRFALALAAEGFPMPPELTERPTPFRISEIPNGSFDDGRQEVVIQSKALRDRAMRAVNTNKRNREERRADEMPSRMDNLRGQIKKLALSDRSVGVALQKLIHDPKNTNDIPANEFYKALVIKRALDFESLIRYHKYTDNYMSIWDLAQELGKAAGGIAAGGKIQNDAVVNLEALRALMNVAMKHDYKLFQIHDNDIGKTIKNPSTGMDVYAKDAMVRVIDPSNLRNAPSPDEGNMPIAAGGAMPSHDLDMRKRAAATRAASTRSIRQQQRRQELDDVENMMPESEQWMEIQALLEHWQF